MRFPAYHPPVMNRVIVITNPSRANEMELDDFGRETPVQVLEDPDDETSDLIDQPPQKGWKYECRANRRDARVTSIAGEEGAIYDLRTIFTIRRPSDITIDYDCIIELDSVAYRSIGHIERGGANGGMSARFIEIHTLRTD